MRSEMSIWSSQSWREDAEAWIGERMTDLGRTITGPIEQPHLRPWGTLLRVPTSRGPVWFKANSRGTSYEVPLTEALGRWSPPGIVGPIAVDVERSWMLLPDAGRPIRESQVHDLQAWLRFLSEYGRLQVELIPHTEELLALGVPDCRPTALSGLLRELLDEPDWLGVGSYGPTVEEHRRLVHLVDTYDNACVELDALGIPSCLQHDDMHDGNVFGSPESGFAFLDWGDAVIGHPFGSLLMPLRVAARHGLAPGTAELDKLRDAYLEPWTAKYDRATLLTATELALRVVHIGRVFTLHRALLGATHEERMRYADWFGNWFRELLDVEQNTE